MTTKITYSPVLPRSSLTGTSGYYRDVFADGVLVGEVFRRRIRARIWVLRCASLPTRGR